MNLFACIEKEVGDGFGAPAAGCLLGGEGVVRDYLT